MAIVSRGLPSLLFHVVAAAGQDPGRTETYLFTVNEVSISLPRGTSGSQASGYQQYPYFGGHETAPHLITILIKSF